MLGFIEHAKINKVCEVVNVQFLNLRIEVGPDASQEARRHVTECLQVQC